MANKRFLPASLLLLVFLSAVSSEEGVHVLQRGETIYTLARRYDLAADTILSYNEISDPTRLAVGTRIRIPGSYVVQQGEYVYSIARKLDVDWLELLEINGLDRDDVVRPGDVLLVPGASASDGPSASEGAAAVNETTGVGAGTRDDGSAAAPASATGGRGAARDATAGADGSGSAGEIGGGSAGQRVNWPHPGRRQSWDGKFPGIVMRGSEGDEFRSVTRGVVEFVGPFSSFGKLILVRSENGFVYGYAGADRVLVTKDERVEPGTILGTVGFSPAFDSAMVLFTVWRNNRYVDPETAPRG
jgi:murein DD-endopeptidase MepM/ murein hydrolase activator NlpD